MMQRFPGNGKIAVLIGLLLALLTRTDVSSAQDESGDASKRYARELEDIERKLSELRRAGVTDELRAEEENLRNLLREFSSGLDRLGLRVEAERSPLKREIDFARREIEDLRAAGGIERADELRERLVAFERAERTADFAFPRSDEPELHVVSIERGSTLPPRYEREDNRLYLGFAEVVVSYAARPVVLALTSEAPVLWKVQIAPGARIRAVVLAGPNQQLVGLDAETLVLTIPTSTPGSDNILDPLEALTGRPTMTSVRAASYGGEPFEIGAANRDWFFDRLRVEVDSLIEDARVERQRIGLADLAGLRFEAMHFGGAASPPWARLDNVSYGTYSIAGPIMDTLRPIHRRRINKVVQVPGDDRRDFALSERGDLVVFLGDDSDEPKPFVVPPSNELAGRVRFCSMAYDPRRNRLLLSTDDAKEPRNVFYDVASSQWNPSIPADTPLFGLTYSPEEDVFHGLVPIDAEHPGRGPTLVKLDAEGKVLATVKPRLHDTLLWKDRRLQVVAVEGYVVIVAPSFMTDPRTGHMHPTKRQLFVVAPTSGDVRYSGVVRCHSGAEPVIEKGMKTKGDGMLAEIDEKLTIAANVVAAAGRAEPRPNEDLRSRLAELRRMLKGHMPDRKDSKLHLVGIQEPHATRVRVTDKLGPITLVLCSYNKSTWTIEADEGVRLERIIVGGYHAQKVAGSSIGVPVEIYSHEQQRPGFYTYGPECDSHHRAVRTLKQYTPLEIATIVGGYSPPGETVIVGPENGNWRAQEVLTGLKELIAEAIVDQSTRTLDKLRKEKFHAFHFGPLPDIRGKPAGRGQQFISAFTVDGPLVGRGMPVSGRLNGMCHDPVRATTYVRSGETITMIDMDSGMQTSIDFDQELPRLSHPSGMAVDTKRQRLLLTSHGGGGYLYGYDLTNKKWSVLRKPGISTTGIVYAPDQDAILAVAEDMGSSLVREIHKYNSHGALVDRIVLEKPISTHYELRSKFQFVYFSGYLAILRHAESDPFRRPGQAPEESRASILVFDSSNGALVHEGELVPHVERRELWVTQLAEIWRRLVDEDGRSESLAWDMASGHDATVAFLRGMLTDTGQVAADDVGDKVTELVRQLDDDKFAVRSDAFRQLQGLGSVILPELREHAASPLSPEAGSRVRKLIAAWESGLPQNDREKRLILAVDVLSRIPSPKAKETLGHVAANGPPVVRYGAKKVLDEPNETEGP